MELNDDQVILFANTVSKQIQHFNPSQKTLQMFEEMNKKNESMQKSVDSVEHKMDLHVQDFGHFKDTMATWMETHSKQEQERNDLIQKQLDSKADKWVQKTLSSIGWFVILAVIGALLGLVIIK